MGKDNIPFHTIFWPAMVLANGDFNLPRNVIGLQYLNYGEIEIFSKKNFKHQLLVQILPKALLLPVRVKRPNLANVMHSLRSLFKTLEL